MKLQVLFNSESAQKELSTGWGFSCLVDERVLFDTGDKVSCLANNFNQLEVDTGLLKAVVISHDHWDHTGGLEEALKKKPGLEVSVCPNFSKELKRKIISLQGNIKEESGFREVVKNIYVTGEISGMYKQKKIAEQALVLSTDNGLTVVTGCAHPGILKIIDKVRAGFPEKQIYAVLGGFHLLHETRQEIETVVRKFLRRGIRVVGPTHCSGAAAEDMFKKEYQENFVSLRVGEDLEV